MKSKMLVWLVSALIAGAFVGSLSACGKKDESTFTLKGATSEE